MNKKLKRRWVAALRSGEYKQITGRVCNEHGYCAYGILTHVVLSNAVSARIPEKAISTIVSMNDCGGRSFAQIADWIEVNL